MIDLKILVSAFLCSHLDTQLTNRETIRINENEVYIQGGQLWNAKFRARYRDVYDLICILNKEFHLGLNADKKAEISDTYKELLNKWKR